MAADKGRPAGVTWEPEALVDRSTSGYESEMVSLLVVRDCSVGQGFQRPAQTRFRE
jgi:hypothetical protein